MTAFNSKTVTSRTCWYYLFNFLQIEIWWQSRNCHDANNFLQTSPCPPAIWKIYSPHYTSLLLFLLCLSIKATLSSAAWLLLDSFAWISCVANLCAMCTCPPNRDQRQPRHFPWVMSSHQIAVLFHLCGLGLCGDPALFSISVPFSMLIQPFIWFLKFFQIV